MLHTSIYGFFCFRTRWRGQRRADSPHGANFHSERKQHHEPQKNHRHPARSPHAARPHRLRRGHDVSRAGRKRPGRGNSSFHDRKQPVPRRHGMRLRAEQLAGERRDRHQRSRGKRRRRLRRGLRRTDRTHSRRSARQGAGHRQAQLGRLDRRAQPVSDRRHHRRHDGHRRAPRVHQLLRPVQGDDLQHDGARRLAV